MLILHAKRLSIEYISSLNRHLHIHTHTFKEGMIIDAIVRIIYMCQLITQYISVLASLRVCVCVCLYVQLSDVDDDEKVIVE